MTSVGIGAVADDVAEQERPVVPSPVGVGEAGVERFQVRVNVGEDKIAH